MSRLSNNEPIAVIGMACRLPGGADSPSKLWELLHMPRDLRKRVPLERFDVTGFYHPNGSQHGATDATTAYFLDEDVNKFDNTFFNIQPAEAEAIDPQQRLLMETVYDSLCAGGQAIETLRGTKTAVYVGQMCDDWSQLVHRDWDVMPTYAATGTSRAIISNRVSYFFDWHGPSMTIDTACSSSLVAVHQAVTALRNGECPIAIAAGANLIVAPGTFIAESNLHMLSPTGSSKMWDASADGYARGEGVAAVVLKPLSAALRDGDNIDCIVRGTAVNQDGKTVGLTMPSNIAQTSLIKDTYIAAGLDINDPKDRPQFFHAHGTGTPAGDPQEAEAISRAFFSSAAVQSQEEKLYVGSIKTVIGHTEGSAGLASFIGSAMAMKHGIIPPNLHFNKLSARVAPFYDHLHIPTTALPWPKPLPGQPRRVSVNSFGFGGTNSHAIIESYEDPGQEHTTWEKSESATQIFAPLTVSAASSTALRSMLQELSDFIASNQHVSLRDLGYTLQTRRSTLPFRAPIVAASLKEAMDRINALLADDGDTSQFLTTRCVDVSNPRLLGVFTGQGAQWPRMGARLLEESPFAAQRIAELQRALSTLPEADRPSWTIYSQLTAGPEKSRLAEAAIAQPLCTAVQIVLVDLLRATGVKLSAVVGHSSGEIAAAYAAGFLSGATAIRVAYYRGLYAKLARSPSGGKGAMMAVGTSYEDAQEFCELEDFDGRIQVAARNSLSSITLSGDDDAIEEATAIFKDEGKFARALQVDTAYHSAHMLPCAAPYLAGLARVEYCADDGNDTRWFSSVIGGGCHVMTKEDVQNPQYWVDNMTSSVLFEPAIRTAATEIGNFDIAIEFGPHPALKGPALDTLAQLTSKDTPYTGLLGRNKNDVHELGTAIGFLWRQLGALSINFEQFELLATSSKKSRSTMVDLPKYPFDHSRSFGSLTRFSGSHRNVHSPLHPLLGRRLVESETAHEISWRNILRASEISWLQGHALQGQTVFPATGYISVTVEAVAAAASGSGKQLGLINVENVVIGRALAFSDDNAGMETKVTLRIDENSSDNMVAYIAIYSGIPSDTATSLALNFTATVTTDFHEPQPDTLAATRRDEPLNLVGVDLERLYSQFTKLGYNYKSPFTGVRSLRRKLGFSTGEIEDESGNDGEDQLLLHPGWLDSSIQTGSAAYSHPHDNRLFALFVPTAIRSVAINPYYFNTSPTRNRKLHFQTGAQAGPPDAPMVLDINIFVGNGQDATHVHPFLQFDSINMRPFATPVARDDAVVFSRFHYGLSAPDADLAVAGEQLVPAETKELWRTFDRVGFFYLRRLYETITPAEAKNTLPHFQHLLGYAGRLIEAVRNGINPVIPAEASNDSPAFVRSLIAKHHDRSDMQMVEAVGENIVAEVRRNGSMLEHMMKDGLLDRFYAETAGVVATNFWIARIVAQIAHRHPRMNLLEVGAGTGSTTRPVLAALDGAFSSYTFTDIGAGFLSRAQGRFANHPNLDRMRFAAFDLEKPAEEQGFELGAYDIIIASNVLHATSDLGETLTHVRSLLRPGGYLIALEIVGEYPIGINAVMGGIPGWWAGAAAGDPKRRDGPCLTLDTWNDLTRGHGFSGIDTHTPVLDNLQWFSVWVAQAVDERVMSLRAPLNAPISGDQKAASQLLIVGGRTEVVADLCDAASTLLSERYAHITQLKSLEDLNEREIAPGSSVLSLTELDEQLLEARSESKLNALKTLWRNGSSILWVTRSARHERPYSSIMIGLARVVAVEYPKINLQLLDFDTDTDITPKRVAEALVRLEVSERLEKEDDGVSLLWTREPETHFVDGRLRIPRLLRDTDANKRYNSYRRAVEHEVDARDSQTTLLLEPSTGKSDLLELVTPSPLRVRAPTAKGTSGRVLTLQTRLSLLQAVKIPEVGYLNLLIGEDAHSPGERYLALTNNLVESLVYVPLEWTIRVPNEVSGSALKLSLASVGSRILAQSVLHAVAPYGTILVHEASPALRHALLQEAVLQGVQLVFTTADKNRSKLTDDGIIFLHAKLPLRRVREHIPRDVSFVVDLSLPSTPGADAANLIVSSLSLQTACLRVSDLVQARPGVYSEADVGLMQAALVLKAAWQSTASARRSLSSTKATAQVSQAPELELQDTIGVPVINTQISIVNWESSSPVRALVRGIDHGSIFRADGTYFLVGLAGDMGQSLCTWMVSHGARYIVLSSRRPKVNPRFVQDMAAEGAQVKVVAADVTQRESLRAAYNEIRAEMPPVIGVANGAMLLEDSMFDDLEFASFDRTAAPKIDGSVHLDELFYDDPLDFFILFTSTAQVVGNGGQSAYVMENQFMSALAAQRRDVRGVAGSDMAIGSVYGLGYFEHAEHLASDHFTRLSYRNISENDLHELFAEAILAGRPGNKGTSEVATGVSPFQDSDETHPALRNSPRFSHFMLPNSADNGRNGGAAGAGKMERPRARLAHATSESEALAIVREAFFHRLKSILMLPQDEIVNEHATFIEQGVDSIMAVEVRAWFLQELDVDLPVLKILGAGSTVESLLVEALSKIPVAILDLTNSSKEKVNLKPAAVVAAPKPVQASHASVPAPPPTTSTYVDTSSVPTTAGSPSTEPISGSSIGSRPGTPLETPFEEPYEKMSEAIDLETMVHQVGNIALDQDRRESILASSIENIYPMTYGQKRFWFLSQFIESPTTFNVAYLARLEGPVRVNELSRAVEIAAQRHEALRTRFFWSDDKMQTPMQGILSKSLVRLETAMINSEAEAEAELDAMRDYVWNLGDWIQVRLRLLTLSDNIHYIVMGTPHISMDGHSMSMLMLDIHQAYTRPERSLSAVQDSSQIRAFGEAQQLAHRTGRFQAALEYYRNALKPVDLKHPVQLLSFARSQLRLPLEFYVNNIARARLSSQTAAAIKELARGNKATSFHAYLAALQGLLFRLLSADSTQYVVIGIADANRLDSKFMGSVGNFLNVLPLVFRRDSTQTFDMAVQETRTKVYAALEHSALPFDLLLDELAVPRSSAHPPMFQIFMDYKLVTREQANMSWAGTHITEQKWHAAKSSYDIALEIVEDHEGASVALHMQDALYSQGAAELLLRSYVNVLNLVVGQGRGAVSMKSLAKWSKEDTNVASSLGKGPILHLEWPTVSHRFDEIASRFPGNIAVKDGFGHSLSYADLSRRVESIVQALRAQLPNIAREPCVVGVFQEVTADWMASMLAILRVGAIYLPLDLKVSTARLKIYVKAAKAGILLVDRGTISLLADIGVEEPSSVINVSELKASGNSTGEISVNEAQLDSPAYIIFTSGSSGEPKGVVVKHDSFRALAEGYVRHWDITTHGQVVLQQFPLTSDGSFKQILSALATGGTLIVAPQSARGDPSELTRIMREEKVTFVVTTPSEWTMWLQYAPDTLHQCTALTSAWFGGERPPPSLLESFRELSTHLPKLRFYNSFGPTEATVSTAKGELFLHECNAAFPVPSHVLPNYAVYIVDEELQLVPAGVPGEILIAGAGVGGNEYLDNPSLTAKAFVSDSWSTIHSEPKFGRWGRAYRSGDYGRLDAQGRLTVEGRIDGDSQVKVRGFRVELGEIEGVILREAQGNIAQVVVTLRTLGTEDELLVAHVILSLSPDLSEGRGLEVMEDLRARLHSSLPQYMVPAIIVPVKDFPKTVLGKVDRKMVAVLPLPNILPSTSTKGGTLEDESFTSVEQSLSSMWASVLPAHSFLHHPMTRQSDFFQSGGNSLLLVKLQTAIKKAMGEAPRLSKLMNTPKLAEMAVLLENDGKAVDWDKEIALQQDLHEVLHASSRTSTTNLKVLITGATGFLGRHIMSCLASDDRIAEIIALVRPVQGRDMENLFPGLKDSKRLRIVVVDLPHLTPEIAELTEIDMILHVAADRNFWDGYLPLRDVNFITAKELTKLSLRTGADLHVLSSGALAEFEGHSGNTTGVLPRPDAANGYVATKWATEQYLANATQRFDLHATAHRPTCVTEVEDEAVRTKAEYELAQHAVSLSEVLGVRPDFAKVDGTFHIADVKEVAKAVVNGTVARQVQEKGRGSFTTLEYPATASVRIDHVQRYTEELLSRPEFMAVQKLPAIPALNWVGQAKRSGLFAWLFTAQELIVIDEKGNKVVSRR